MNHDDDGTRDTRGLLVILEHVLNMPMYRSCPSSVVYQGSTAGNVNDTGVGH